MSANQTSKSHGEQPVTPLEQVVNDIFERRKKQNKPVFSDPLSFSKKLIELSKKYHPTSNFEANKGTRQRYKSVTKALIQLQKALVELNEDEINLLSATQREYSCTLPPEYDHENLWEEINYVGHPYTLKDLIFNNTFPWLYAASNALSTTSKTGRPEHKAQLELSKDFLYLCHIEHWPITASNSGSEVKGNSSSTESDAVICLAALFTEIGKHKIESLRSAKTMLRKLRNLTIYNQDLDNMHDGDEEVLINLKGITHSSRLRDLPNFTPLTRQRE